MILAPPAANWSMYDAIIEVDGGVNEQTAPMLLERGATMLVAGSALYGAPDAKSFIDHVKAMGAEK